MSRRVINVTIPVTLDEHAMFLAHDGATVSAGEFAGTSLLSNVAGGHPIVYVRKDGKSLGTAWIGTQDLLQAILPVAAAEFEKTGL